MMHTKYYVEYINEIGILNVFRYTTRKTFNNFDEME